MYQREYRVLLDVVQTGMTVVGWKKVQDWSEIWVCAQVDPVGAPKQYFIVVHEDAMVIWWYNWIRKGINLETGSIWSGKGVPETVPNTGVFWCVLEKCQLSYLDVELYLWVYGPLKLYYDEPLWINITVELEYWQKLYYELFFHCIWFYKLDKVVDIYNNVS